METAYRILRLGAPSRAVLAGALYALAAFVQVATRSVPLGFFPVLAAWFVLMPKPTTNKPADLGFEEWRAVSSAEITRIADNLSASRKLRSKVAGPVALGVLALAGLGFGSLLALAAWPPASLALFDFALFLVPGLFFGKVKVHVPAEIAFKLPSFLALMDAHLPEGLVLTPYLRFDKDKEGREIPEDLRFMLEPRRKTADLVGVQLQAAINSGPNGQVPYLYAVALTRGSGGAAYANFSRLRARGYVVEPGGDGEYGTVVIRQETSGGGYHTTPDDCRSLLELCAKALSSLS